MSRFFEVVRDEYRKNEGEIKLPTRATEHSVAYDFYSPVDVIIPPMWCCTDNAAMIAKVALRLYEKKLFADSSLSVDPSWQIDKYNEFK